MPEHGSLTVTVPGAVSGWHALHGQGANLAWADAFTAAVGLRPRRGQRRVDDSPTRSPRSRHDSADAGIAEIFFPRRRPAREARTDPPARARGDAQALAERGPAPGTEASRANDYADGLRALGVPIDLADMAGHRADLGTPLRAATATSTCWCTHRTRRGSSCSRPSRLIERLGIDPDPLGPDAGRWPYVFRAAARDRDRHLADPDAHAAAPVDAARRRAPRGGRPTRSATGRCRSTRPGLTARATRSRS